MNFGRRPDVRNQIRTRLRNPTHTCSLKNEYVFFANPLFLSRPSLVPAYSTHSLPSFLPPAILPPPVSSLHSFLPWTSSLPPFSSLLFFSATTLIIGLRITFEFVFFSNFVALFVLLSFQSDLGIKKL